MEDKSQKKKSITQEERLALAAKLDKELDEFIAGLEKRKCAEGWPEDKWEEEMEKHPFFMTQLPEDGKLPPLLEGIQQLKYDENENTPLELAISYKEDGNFNFQCKKYRMAIISYTEGIRRKCGNPEIEAQLYSNRAAAQFRIENYRSSLSDCLQALKIQPDYVKAKIRAAKCCAKLKMVTDAIKYCDEVIQEKPTNLTALKLRSECVAIKKQQERDDRKQKILDKKSYSSLLRLKTAIQRRKILVECNGDIIESLEKSPERPILENGEICWPVFFLYPEYSLAEYIERFNENSTFFDHLMKMFYEFPPWDMVGEYRPENLSVYYEGLDRNKLYRVNVFNTLLSVLTCKNFIVRKWKPSFIILVRGSAAETAFLRSVKKLTE